jgi:hypothetical protein
MKTSFLLATGMLLSLVHPAAALAADGSASARARVDALDRSVSRTGGQVFDNEREADEAVRELREDASELADQLRPLAGKRSLVSERSVKTVRQTRIDPSTGQLQVRDVEVVEQTWAETRIASRSVRAEVQYTTRRRPTLEELRSRLESSSTGNGRQSSVKVVDVIYDDATGLATVELSSTSN